MCKRSGDPSNDDLNFSKSPEKFRNDSASTTKVLERVIFERNLSGEDTTRGTLWEGTMICRCEWDVTPFRRRCSFLSLTQADVVNDPLFGTEWKASELQECEPECEEIPGRSSQPKVQGTEGGL